MSEHLEILSLDAIERNKKLTFPVKESNTSKFFGKIRYWWGWTIAALMLLCIALPVMIFLRIINRERWFYPYCLWGARTWLKACGAKVKVTGVENLDPQESYV